MGGLLLSHIKSLILKGKYMDETGDRFRAILFGAVIVATLFALAMLIAVAGGIGGN